MTTFGDRITIDPAICHGKPTVRGLRYPVEMILDLLSSGMTHDEILADYPDLEREDILAVVGYAARLSRVKRIDHGAPAPSEPRLDRTALSVAPLFEDSDDRRYWHACTPAERLRHAETLRRINYGRRATERLQRVLELAPLTWR